MANNFSVITSFITKAVDTVFATESKTAVLENGAKYIDVNFNEAGFVKILSVLMDGLSDYYRVNGGTVANPYAHYQNGSGDGYKVGNVSATWELFKLRYDRGKQFQVDNMDDEELAGGVIGNLLTEFLRTKVVPEVDASRFSTIVSKCKASIGNLVSATPNATAGDSAEITHLLNAGIKWLNDHEVPQEEQVIFISSACMALIANSGEIYKRLDQADYTSERGVTFKFRTYEGRPLIEVPSSRFFTDVDINQNGYSYSSTSKKLNFIICSKKAIVPVVKLEKSKIFGPDVVQDFDGYKVNFRIYHDTIIPKNKVIGAYACYDSTTAAITDRPTLAIALSAGKTSGTTVVDGIYTTPVGILGQLWQSKAATFTLGEAETSFNVDAENIPQDGTEFTALDASTNYAVVVDGKVAAFANAVTTPIAD